MLPAYLPQAYICRKHLHIPMKTNSVILLVLWLAAWPFCCRGQGYISYDYLPESSLKDDLGNEYGSGSLMMVSGRYNLPLSVRHDDKGRLVAWSATVNAAYGVFHNKGQARELNPGQSAECQSEYLPHPSPVRQVEYHSLCGQRCLCPVGRGFHEDPTG